MIIEMLKKEIERILNMFGYYKTDVWFEKPDITPPRNQFEGESWSDYWAEFYEPHYLGWYMRCISKYPNILQSLLHEISVYDWADIATHMAETRWFWSNRDRSPYRDELIETVVSLTYHNICGEDFDGENYGGVQTGGFKVSIKNEEVVIEFEKDLSHDW